MPPTSPTLTPDTADFDWAAARGEKWRAQLGGLEAMLAPVDEPLILALRLDAPYRVADVGCGGGGTSREILRRAPQGSVVHGFDLSPALIDSARANVHSLDDAIAFEIADVATGAPPQPPYDRLVSRFGTMFYENPPLAFENLARWLAPGGRFAFAVWGPAVDNPWLALIREVAVKVTELPTPDPEAPGPFRYARPDRLLALLKGAGFSELEAHDWRGTFQIGGGLPPAEAARFALASFSVGELVAAKGEGVLSTVQEALTARFAQHLDGNVVRLPACVRIVTGVRPA